MTRACTIATNLGALALRLVSALAVLARTVATRWIPVAWQWVQGSACPAAVRFYRWLPHRRFVAGGAVALAVVLAVFAAWPDSPPERDASPGPVTLTFAPAKAPPAAPILLSDVPAFDSGELEVRIGDHVVPAQWLPDGRIQAHVPVRLGEDGWPVAPRGEQLIEVRRSGLLVARSDGGLRVLDLERAPGTTARVQQSLVGIVAGYERIFESLPAQDASDLAHRRAVMATLRGLVSEGDRSLAAVVAGDSPWLEGAAHDLELTDALLASSGVAGHYAARAAIFPGPPPAGAGLPMSLSLPIAAVGPRCRPGGKAFDLACQMQAHGLITDLSQAYIKPTADTYADLVGLALGAAGIDPATRDVVKTGGRNVMAVHQIISALLSVVNFTMEKIAPSLLPSVLSSFELEVDPVLIRKGDMTTSRLMVEARNQPQTITANDLVDLVKSILGLPGLSKPFEKKVVEVGFFVIDLYMAALRRFGVEPPAVMNPEVFTMPLRTWGPLEVDDADLVKLFSYDTSVLAPREEELEWQGVGTGMAKVRMMPRDGERAKVLEDNTLCWRCVWSGGAFGTEMPEGSKHVSVDIAFEAQPPRGRAPHRTTLAWKLQRRQDRAPMPCTIDFGDGSRPERIPDCSSTRSVRHVYAYTSRLEDGGAWRPTLRLDENGMESETEVFTDWRFTASPDGGQAPLEAKFRWEVPWPGDRKPPACEFDPGDGSEVRRFNDCLATDRTTHTFDRGGSFVPTLTLIHDGRRDSMTAPVSVAREGICDEDLLRHRTWRGHVSYSHSRDVWDHRATLHLRYRHGISLGGEMHERTRRTDKGGDYLVQYYSPLPEGSASVTYNQRRYSGRELTESTRFAGTGRLKRQEPHMVEEGSFLLLTVNARKCTFRFVLQADVEGHGKYWEWVQGERDYTGYRRINSIHGEGTITSSGSISGSAPFPLLRRSEFEDPQFPKPPMWTNEMDSVARAMRGQPLGSIFVTWHFEPVD